MIESWYNRLGEVIVAFCTAAISYMWWRKKKREGRFDQVCDELQKLSLRQEIAKVEASSTKELFTRVIEELQKDIAEIKSDLKSVVQNVCKTNKKKNN